LAALLALEADIKRAMESGAVGFLLKDAPAAELAGAS
jgi:DNA-binding NarL/FixJ family response regulator